MKFIESIKENKMQYTITFLLLIFCILSCTKINRDRYSYDEHDYLYAYFNDDHQEIISASNYTKDFAILKVTIPQSWFDGKNCRVVVNSDSFVEYNDSDYYKEIINKNENVKVAAYDLVCRDDFDDIYLETYNYDLEFEDATMELVDIKNIDNIFDIIEKPTTTTLERGYDVNYEIKNIAKEYNDGRKPYNIKSISVIDITNKKPNVKCSINVAEDYLPVYLCYDKDEQIMYMYTEAEKIYLNKYSNSLFDDLNTLTKIKGFDKLDFSNVENMSYMFANTAIESLDLSNLDLTNVGKVDGLFYNTTIDTLKLGNLQLPNVISFEDMFNGIKTKVLDLNNLDTKNVIIMAKMFKNAEIEKLNISKLNTSKVYDMREMFYNANIGEFDLSNFDTSSLIDADYMFKFSYVTKLDLSNFKFPNLNNNRFKNLFSYTHNLKHLDISSLDYENFVDKDTQEPNHKVVLEFFKDINKEVTIIVKDEKMKRLILNHCDNIKDSNVVIKK